jgi:hypothetical protein
LDLVLVEVGKRDAAIGFGDHVPDFLDAWVMPGGESLECVLGFWVVLKAPNLSILHRSRIQCISY